MRTFTATIFTTDGTEQMFTLKAPTLDAVRQYLHEKGFTIKKIQEQEAGGIWKKLQSVELGSRIKPANLVRILRSLGQMIQRGYPIESIIDFLLADERDKDVVKFLSILQRKASKGYKDFVELFSEAREYIDDEFFSVLIAGQKTGTVGENIIDYANGRAKMLEQKGKLIKTLSGKFVILGVVLAAFLVIVLFVVPQFTKLFGKKLELPLGMKIMVGISNLFRNYAILVFGSLVGIVAAVLILYQFHLPFRFAVQHVLLKIPVLGPLLRMMETRDFLSMMGNLMTKGVSIMEAIRIVINQTKNLCFRSVYDAIEKNLEKGRKLEQILRQPDPVTTSGTAAMVPVPSGYLLPSVAQAMTLGSKGGNLGEMLHEAYLTYDFQLQNRMDTSIRVIGAAISVFTYLVILFMIGSLASTLFKVMQDPTSLIS